MTTNVDFAPSQPTQQTETWWQQVRRTLSNATIITRREVRDSFRDWRIIVPIFVLTFLFPFLAQTLATEFREFLEGYGAELIGERTIPFLLMVVGFFPISISLVIALETFVGEKERRSLEPLLSTPLTNTELYIGKTLAAMIPPLASSFGGMAVYLGSLLFSELAWRPPAMLIIQIILLTTVQALVMVTGAVVVSSQANSTRAANLLASFIIIPMALIIQGESVIMFLAPDAESARGIGALWAVIAGMFVVAVMFLRVGNSIFNREELLSGTIDRLNLRGIVGKIWRYVVAVDVDGTPAKNIMDWYRRAIPFSLRRVKVAFSVVSGVLLVAFIIGAVLSQTPQWQLPIPSQAQLSAMTAETDGARAMMSTAIQSENLSFSFIFTQNSRVLLATLILSIFSFGVAALIIPPLTFVILGYLAGLLLTNGYNIMVLIVGVGTHGILEIPAIMLAASVALALGASVTKPPPGMTVGHAWVMRLGDTLKLTFGVIIPLLLIAALIEAFITPGLVVALL
jgi:uncharacterized membrane protein SpoIIM required for sporulation/ABC-type transport system involved in multi-copper enzyme maturation permease subunit